ncbi:14641_t:CDS:2, partial [Gigaspora rosea]
FNSEQLSLRAQNLDTALPSSMAQAGKLAIETRLWRVSSTANSVLITSAPLSNLSCLPAFFAT